MKTSTIIGIILVPLVFFLTAFAMFVYNADFHSSLLDKYSNHPELGKEIDIKLINYFKSDAKIPPPINEFTAEENQHLLDVKIRINQTIAVYLILLASLLAILYFSNEKRKIFLYGGPLTALPFLIYEAVPFDVLFEKFHLALFAFSRWQFPIESMLVNVFTTDFFYLFACSLTVYSIVLGLGSAILAWLSKY